MTHTSVIRATDESNGVPVSPNVPRCERSGLAETSGVAMPSSSRTAHALRFVDIADSSASSAPMQSCRRRRPRDGEKGGQGNEKEREATHRFMALINDHAPPDKVFNGHALVRRFDFFGAKGGEGDARVGVAKVRRGLPVEGERRLEKVGKKAIEGDRRRSKARDGDRRRSKGCEKLRTYPPAFPWSCRTDRGRNW